MHKKLLVIINFLFGTIFSGILILIIGSIIENIIEGELVNIQDDLFLIIFYSILCIIFAVVYFYIGNKFRKTDEYSKKFIICIGIIYLSFGLLLSFLGIIFGFITASNFYWNILSILTIGLGGIHLAMIFMLKSISPNFIER